jgi:hypothetical protein
MVELDSEESGANVKRGSNNLFVYFAIMQVVVIVSTIFAVQRVQDAQHQDIKNLHSKLEEIFAQREQREALMRQLALNGSSISYSSNPDHPQPLPLPKLPSVKSVIAEPEIAARSSVPAPVIESLPPAAERLQRKHKDGDPGSFINGHGFNYKQVESVEDAPKGEWDDGYNEDGNCSGALRMPGGGKLQHILMPDVDPMPDSRIWLLNVGAGTTGTRTVQREICKRQVSTCTYFHASCAVPYGTHHSSSCAVMFAEKRITERL